MKTRVLIIIGISIVTAISLSYYAIYDSSTTVFISCDPRYEQIDDKCVLKISETDYEELECLRLYKDIREISRTDGFALAERETIDMHKSLVFEYVEKNCPDFPDLEFMYDNYKQTLSEPETKEQQDLSVIEKLLMENQIDTPKELVVQRAISTGGDPACGIAVDGSDKLHWFAVDSFSNPHKMTVFQENPHPCKVNTTSCFCNVYTELMALTIKKLTYFTLDEEQKYSNILIDYLAEENINRTPKFLIGKLNVNYTDSSAIGYCGEIWGTNTYGFFSGAIVNDIVMDYGIDKELPLLCAISDDAKWWERK